MKCATLSFSSLLLPPHYVIFLRLATLDLPYFSPQNDLIRQEGKQGSGGEGGGFYLPPLVVGGIKQREREGERGSISRRMK